MRIQSSVPPLEKTVKTYNSAIMSGNVSYSSLMIRRCAVHKDSLLIGEKGKDTSAQHILIVSDNTGDLTFIHRRPFMLQLNTPRLSKACFF
jgi:hypothetical protein